MNVGYDYSLIVVWKFRRVYGFLIIMKMRLESNYL